MNELIDFLKIDSWLVFAAFGMYLAHKVAIAGFLTWGAVKVVNTIAMRIKEEIKECQ
jgi:hypothetical protein